MQRSLGEEVLTVGQFADEKLLDAGEPVAHGVRELLVAEIDSRDDSARPLSAHDVSTHSCSRNASAGPENAETTVVN